MFSFSGSRRFRRTTFRWIGVYVGRERTGAFTLHIIQGAKGAFFVRTKFGFSGHGKGAPMGVPSKIYVSLSA
jgi:hypothetical protein